MKIEQALKPLLLTKAFGFPFAIETSTNWFRWLLHNIYCVLLIIVNLLIIIWHENVKFQSSDVFTQITSRIKVNVNNVSYLTILVIFLLKKSKNSINVINSLREIETIYDEWRINISHGNARNFLITTIGLELVFNVIQMVCLNNLLVDGALKYYIQSCLPTNFCNFLILHVETYVFLTGSFLKCAGRIINNTKFRKKEKENFTRNFLTFPRHKIRQDYVPFIKLVHGKLYEVSVRINETFSLVLLFYVANCFVSIYSLSFFTWRGFLYNGNHFYSTVASGTTTTTPNIQDASHYVFMIVSIFLCTLHILILCYFCQRAHNENENIKFILHDNEINSEVSVKWFNAGICKFNFSLQVFQLSLQMIHEDITFSAGGFFDINFILLTMVSIAVIYSF